MKIFFAYIIKPHSIHGEVELNSAEHELLSIGDNLYTENNDRYYKIMGIKKKPLRTVLKFEGVESRNEAETLRGVGLFIDTDEISIPDDGDSYFVGELVGMDTIDIDGNKNGTVVGYYETKAHGILEIETCENRKIDVPFVSRYVCKVDKENSLITVTDFDTFLE